MLITLSFFVSNNRNFRLELIQINFFKNDVIKALWFGHDEFNCGTSFHESEILEQAIGKLEP